MCHQQEKSWLVFWVEQGIILLKFLPGGSTANSDQFNETIRILNAHLYPIWNFQKFVQHLRPTQNGRCCHTHCTVLTSLHLIFTCLVLWKSVNDGALLVICQWLQMKDRNFYQAGIHVLVWRWKKTVNKDVNYTEEYYAFSNAVVKICEILTYLTYKWHEVKGRH